MCPFLPVNCRPAARTRQVGVRLAGTECALVTCFASCYRRARWPVRRRMWENTRTPSCTFVLSGTGLLAHTLVIAQPPAWVRILGTDSRPPHQTVNFASADADVAERAIIQARKLSEVTAGAQLRLDCR